jgi:hypothetical protein
MIISHKYKFIFVKTAKTAGTSIEVFLDRYCGEEDVLTPFAFPEEGHRPRNYRGGINYPREFLKSLRANRASFKTLRGLLKNTIIRTKFYHHIPAWRIRERVSPKVWNTYFKFAVERNPWDKVISGWFYDKEWYNSDLTLDEYLDFCERRIRKSIRGSGRCPYNYPNYIDPHTGKVMVDRIIKYENLYKEFKEILDTIGIESKSGLDVFAKKSSRERDYIEFYNEQQKDRVGELFKKEIELHGYTFN